MCVAGGGGGYMGAGQGSLSYMTGEGETVLCDGALMTIIEGEQVGNLLFMSSETGEETIYTLFCTGFVDEDLKDTGSLMPLP